jgi:DDE superfamily endonuclease
MTEVSLNSVSRPDKWLRAASTRSLMMNDPMLYMGVPKESIDILHLLRKLLVNSNAEDAVKIVLRKIRRNESFQIIANDFGLDRSRASKIFNQNLPVISACLKQLIVWPSSESISKLQPIQFRSCFSKVESIIDGFEIQIEKRSNAVRQSLTSSEYKHANTFKYLISITPNGLINFVSTGYGGRISDTLLTEVCGYTSHLLPGTQADRGFKHVASLLQSKQCTLIKPVSVKENVKTPKEEKRKSNHVSQDS